MNKAFDKLQKMWEEHPEQVIALAAFTALSVAKLLDATTKARNARTYRLEIDRRMMKSYR